MDTLIAKLKPHTALLGRIFWAALASGLLVLAAFSYFLPGLRATEGELLSSLFTLEFLLYLLVGFGAQLIDGALGMAYGISCTSFLMSMGVNPAAASASVHVAKVFASGASGWSHFKLGNVNTQLFSKLIVPGSIGAIVGALLLSHFDGKGIKPFVSLYLVLMGMVVIRKALGWKPSEGEVPKVKRVRGLALFGGFMDALGGGGWGPIVTSTLLGRGLRPHYIIGTVNAAEFFVAVAGGAVFALTVGVQSFPVMAGLIGGGLLAAPVAASFCRRINPRALMFIVGALVTGLSLHTIIKAWL